MSESIPVCDAADPFPRAPAFTIPPGACDTHAHVFGTERIYPYTPNRTYTPPDAPVGAYRHLHERLGIARGVLVQPSVYGTDNRLQMDALAYLRGQGLAYKGVAVVDADARETELDQLEAGGHCGVRMNLLFKGGIQWRDVEVLAQRLATRNWHLQFLIDVSEFEDLESRIRALPVPVVVDHMGHMDCRKGLEHPGFQALLNLLRDEQVWVKLSGAYRITAEQQPPYTDVDLFAQALVEANPNRCVWGSDWPHPHFSIPMPNDGDLLDLLARWVPDEAVRNRILVDNPAALYGF
ncbi:amidohydrolase family protein [Marinobacterium stanieri]|uniref:Predicted metal-dependent hydrolase, TIM-barrel fold n=1 Tax=Marinobacterium stanieri TaxID=49186 RepID=A0A1N6QES8_9GAMM|nr:amidohydrolase family protein [Marinobacterium stanieri]SIQ15097.1 Predicted metal-dependent hydrolase, TIM-barrel fold [Marinobacterium stanieri]